MSEIHFYKSGNTFEDLVEIQTPYYCCRWRMYDERADKRQRDDYSPNTDQIQDHAVSGIASAFYYAGIDRHLIAHTRHNETENVQERACEAAAFFGKAVKREHRFGQCKEDKSTDDAHTYEHYLESFYMIPDLILFAAADDLSY